MRIQDKRSSSSAGRSKPTRPALTGILVYKDPSEQLFVIDEDRSIFAAIPKEERDMTEEEQLMRENGWLDDWFGKDKDKEKGKGKDNPKGEMPVMTLSALRASTGGNDREGSSQSTGWWDEWFGNGDKRSHPSSKQVAHRQESTETSAICKHAAHLPSHAPLPRQQSQRQECLGRAC